MYFLWLIPGQTTLEGRWKVGCGDKMTVKKGYHVFTGPRLKKGRQFFKWKKGDTVSLPRRVTTTLVTPLQRRGMYANRVYSKPFNHVLCTSVWLLWCELKVHGWSLTWRESVQQWTSEVRVLIALAAISTYANYWVRAVDSTAAQSIRFAGKHRVSVRLSVSPSVCVCACVCSLMVVVCGDCLWRMSATNRPPTLCAYIASHFDDNWHTRRAVHNSWPLSPPAAVHGVKT